MKLSKSLLSAIVVGIALQGAVACTKSKEDPTNKTAEQQAKEKKKAPVDPCPACGMG